MTENQATPVVQEAPLDHKSLFSKLRVDPELVKDGAWITHPETGDEFKVRKLWCAQHVNAFLQAKQDHEDAHGEGTLDDDEEAQIKIQAVAMAAGVIIDWKLKGNPDRPYDKAMMAQCLADPELAELLQWITVETSKRSVFRPKMAGN